MRSMFTLMAIVLVCLCLGLVPQRSYGHGNNNNLLLINQGNVLQVQQLGNALAISNGGLTIINSGSRGCNNSNNRLLRRGNRSLGGGATIINQRSGLFGRRLTIINR